jgi:RimJ/RimL family protein N-acetyltransferase
VTDVRLVPIDGEAMLQRLLAVAVADAEPDEVMPPVPGPPGWTPARRDAFRDFHRGRYDGLTGIARTAMFAIATTEGDVIGMIRLTRLEADDEAGIAETGIWLGRSARGRGIGTAALRALLCLAGPAGVHTVVAGTTSANTAALRVLDRCGADLTPHEPSATRIDAVIHVPAVRS